VADHPVKVPPELFTEWLSEALLQHDAKSGTIAAMVADKAAQWGADQELEACIKWTAANFGELPGQNLHLYRRPKPPSLAERALNAVISGFDPEGRSGQVVIEALNRLAELEAQQ
jgi:hypothetical protein